MTDHHQKILDLIYRLADEKRVDDERFRDVVRVLSSTRDRPATHESTEAWLTSLLKMANK